MHALPQGAAEGNLVDAFSRVLGVFVHYTDEQVGRGVVREPNMSLGWAWAWEAGVAAFGSSRCRGATQGVGRASHQPPGPTSCWCCKQIPHLVQQDCVTPTGTLLLCSCLRWMPR